MKKTWNPSHGPRVLGSRHTSLVTRTRSQNKMLRCQNFTPEKGVKNFVKRKSLHFSISNTTILQQYMMSELTEILSREIQHWPSFLVGGCMVQSAPHYKPLNPPFPQQHKRWYCCDYHRLFLQGFQSCCFCVFFSLHPFANNDNLSYFVNKVRNI